MDFYLTLSIFLPSLWLFIYFLKCNSSQTIPTHPEPRTFPIIGNLYQLGDHPHRTLANLAKVYGPIISLKFGSITTIVVSSADVAKDMFQKHDLALSSRKVTAAVRANGDDHYSMAWLSASPKWRYLRKMLTARLFSMQRLDGRQVLCHAKIIELLDYIKTLAELGETMDIGEAAFRTSLNLLSNTFSSSDMASNSLSEAGEFKELVWNIMEEIGKPDLADCFPLVRFCSCG